MGREPTAVHCGILDYDASLRARRFTGRAANEAVEKGFSFPDVLYRWDTGEQVLDPAGKFGSEPCVVDPSSRRAHPFDEGALIYLADYAGISRDLSPREVLRRQIARLEARGWRASAAFECEFTVLDETAQTLRAKRFDNLAAWLPGNHCWSADSTAASSEFVAGLAHMLGQLGIPLHSIGCELGPGCFEATLEATEPMRAADDYALLRCFTKAFCRRRGLTASFLAQLGDGFQGMSGHLHLSLADKHGRNLFFGEGDEAPETLRHFIGGLLTLLPEACAVCTHTVNAWRRMTAPNWAPRTPCWDLNDYGAAVRAVVAPHEAARIEFRIPAADTHPHLALALVLGAGLWGIEHAIAAPERVRGDPRSFVPAGLRALPRNLLEAAERLAESVPARELFGEAFVSHFARTRIAEDAALRRAVSAAERARYLEVI